MNNYRTLTYQELSILHEDFTNFLYLEGYSRFDWTILVEEHPEFAIDMLNRYSDQAFEKAMQSIEYVEKLKDGQLTTIYCHPKYFDIAAIDLNIEQGKKFRQGYSLAEILNHSSPRFNIRFKKVPYTIQREKEIFNLVERGYRVAKENNFQLIKELKKILEN